MNKLLILITTIQIVSEVVLAYDSLFCGAIPYSGLLLVILILKSTISLSHIHSLKIVCMLAIALLVSYLYICYLINHGLWASSIVTCWLMPIIISLLSSFTPPYKPIVRREKDVGLIGIVSVLLAIICGFAESNYVNEPNCLTILIIFCLLCVVIAIHSALLIITKLI